MAAPSSASLAFPLFLLSSLFLLPPALAEIKCEYLSTEKCALAVAGSGKRCLLEKFTPGGRRGAGSVFQCRTSEVVAEGLANHVETDACVSACGVDRSAIGISSDALLESHFAAKLCAPPCYTSCPNVVDLYFHLAAGEGASLPQLCEAQRGNPRRSMVELLSSGAASGPVAAEILEEGLDATAPASSPVGF